MADKSAEFDLEGWLLDKKDELGSIAQAAASGEHQKVVDGAAGLALTLATGNPLIGALAPFARLAVAKAFGNATDAMLRRELAKLETEEQRRAFLKDIDAVVAALIEQAVIQLVRSQCNVKEQVLHELGGLREEFSEFRSEFAQQLQQRNEAVRIEDELLVKNRGTGVRVRAATLKRAVIKRMVVTDDATGIDLE